MPSPDDDGLIYSDQREWENSNEEGWFYRELVLPTSTSDREIEDDR